MNIALITICAILMILGVAELCRLLVFWWTKPLTKGGLSILVTPKSAEECEAVLRVAVERIRWLDCAGPCQVLCLNPANDPEIEQICRLVSLHAPMVKTVHVRPDDLS